MHCAVWGATHINSHQITNSVRRRVRRSEWCEITGASVSGRSVYVVGVLWKRGNCTPLTGVEASAVGVGVRVCVKAQSI